MYIQQLYTGCLSEAAYYIESNGEAAVIDPLRETEPYLNLAKKRGATIKYVFETHFHADFVSGHIDLAKKTGATIVFGPGADTAYEITAAEDNQTFQLGSVQFKVLHTPGHTPESSCYLLYDEENKPHAVFTGDTLFVGDVGRPDLAVKGDLTKEDLAGMLYDSLHGKIMPLPDNVIVYPAHGAGSACGKNIGKETHSTLGVQKKTNYALQPMSKEEFVKKLTDGLEDPPPYFFKDAMINKTGYQDIEQVIERNTRELSLIDFEKHLSNHAPVLDTRHPDEFEKGFIPGSVNIGLDGTFAVWAGTLLDIETPLLLITSPGKEEESVLRLARVGYENVHGYLSGGFDTWKNAGKQIDTIDSTDPEQFLETAASDTHLLDVRKPGEWDTGVIENAELISLDKLEDHIGRLSKSNHYTVHCAGGYRSMIASSMLKKHGFSNVTNIRKGMNGLKAAGVKLVQQEPSL